MMDLLEYRWIISFIFLFLLILLFYLISKSRQFNIYRWRKSLKLQKHEHVFCQIYQNANGYILSKKARQGRDAMEYTYGEINFLSFIALLSLIMPDEKTVFYDLGSGIGKAVLACSMVFPVRECVGIELFPELHFAACRHAERLVSVENYTEKANNIRFILGDFLEANLNDATLIFINATAFIGQTWDSLCSKINSLAHVNTVIIISKTLSCIDFSLISRTNVEMSWGIVDAYIYVRKTYTN